MIVVVVILALVVVALVAYAARERRRSQRGGGPRAHAAGRILFPFLGTELSERGLDAALRISQIDGATLVPAFLARVPMHLPLDAALPVACDSALPLLEAIEQRAAPRHVRNDAQHPIGNGRAQFGKRSARPNCAAGDDTEAVARIFDLPHLVAREHKRRAGGA